MNVLENFFDHLQLMKIYIGMEPIKSQIS